MTLLQNLIPITSRGRRFVVFALWAMLFIGVPLWSQLDASGWDFEVYRKAIQSIGQEHDPYAEGTRVQIAYHEQLRLHPDLKGDPPYNYVYSPITLPFLRLVSHISPKIFALIYWVLYAAGTLATILVCSQAALPREARYLCMYAPISLFFPGLLENGVILSGNIAYIIYGVTLLTALWGGRQKKWRYFYATVLLGSCFKAPLLTLLAIPVLSAEGQIFAAALTGAAGAGLFAMQSFVWPVLFQHFLTAVELQFSYNRDFGSSPAGIFAGKLFDYGHPYRVGEFVFYIAYAVPLSMVLFKLSQYYKKKLITPQDWMPVMLVGVILLNPRIIEYDLAVISIPLALIIWRALPSGAKNGVGLACGLAFMTAVNILAYQSWVIWKNVECSVLVILFTIGATRLLRGSKAFVHALQVSQEHRVSA